jgi:hypothetical protein
VPVIAFTVATDVKLLLQVPPVILLCRSVVVPTQMLNIPVIPAGAGLIVTVLVAKHPADVAYVTVAVPAVIPVTFPKASTDTSPSRLLHTPPDIASERVVMPPSQTVSAPAIAAGAGFTVSTIVLKQPLDNL